MDTSPRNALSLKTAQAWGKVASLVFRIVLGIVLIITIPLVYIEMKNNPGRFNGTEYKFLISALKENADNMQQMQRMLPLVVNKTDT